MNDSARSANTSYVMTFAGGSIVQYNKVEICGLNTADIKLLTEKEKSELLRKSKSGDRKARDELVKGNLRLVLSVIQRLTRCRTEASVQ